MPTDILIDIAIKDAELTGYVSKDTLKYNLFSWVYIQGTLMEHSAKNTKLEKFLSRFDLFRFKENQCAILRYCFTKRSKVINLRDLETDLIQGLGTGDTNCL
jgi:hypothetical protein